MCARKAFSESPANPLAGVNPGPVLGYIINLIPQRGCPGHGPTALVDRELNALIRQMEVEVRLEALEGGEEF
ncbi:hypothetical protein DFAR_340046 [Desulfarculales bacterium]